MSDEILCVCGHPANEHRYDERNEFGCEECGHANCCLFRPTLPWPNSAGLWWCDRIVPWYVEMIEQADGCFWAEGYGDCGFREEFMAEYGPARFVKLLEQSPFPEH